jgi:hypothetical protein
MIMIKTIILFIATGLIFSTCTIQYSLTGASIPINAKNVSVAEFNYTALQFNPTLSNHLTEALKDKFISQTNLYLVKEEGDLRFEGSIINYETNKPMAIKAGDNAALNRFTITIKVKFTNTLDPKANYDSSFSRYTEYNSDINFTDKETEMVDQLIKELVEDIFNKAVVNW